MRGIGESRGSLGDTSLHDLAVDVAEFLEAMDCGPAHLVGHAFGNRVARCLAVDRPSLVRSVTLLAAGGLIEWASSRTPGVNANSLVARFIFPAGATATNVCSNAERLIMMQV
jgi:pimeloyl-ACP methyl ester carboxylesterase